MCSNLVEICALDQYEHDFLALSVMCGVCVLLETTTGSLTLYPSFVLYLDQLFSIDGSKSYLCSYINSLHIFSLKKYVYIDITLWMQHVAFVYVDWSI